MKKSNDPMIAVTIRIKKSTYDKAEAMWIKQTIIPGTRTEYFRMMIENYVDRKR